MADWKFKNFELEEFITSEIAKAKGIDNTPTFEVVCHLQELVEKILQPLRDEWGSGLTVSSGYRCPALNRAVGGASASAHVAGFAADIRPSNGRMDDFIVFAERWLRVNGIPFDQSIDERLSSKRWWHIGIRSQFGQQRKEFLEFKKGHYYHK